MPPLHTRRAPDLLRLPHPSASRPARSRRLGARPVTLDLRRLEALRDLVAMQPAPAAPRPRVPCPRTWPGSAPPAAPRPASPDPTGRSPSSLMWTKPRSQARSINRRRHIPADRKVRMQPVPARMPLRHPQIRQRPAAQPAPQPPEEPRQVRPQLRRVVAALAPVGQRPEPIQPVRGAVATHLCRRPPRRLGPRPRLIRPATRPPAAGTTGAHETAAGLTRLRVERQPPIPRPHRDHLRVRQPFPG